MRTELKRLHVDTGSTFVYVTHDQLEAMTLATKICLMNEGVVQQYDPPLTVYGQPANLFVADFVGNPTMNFIPGRIGSISGNSAEVELLGKKFTFTSCCPLDGLKGDVTVGIRPEFLPISDNGSIVGSVYSTLPSGMETTVKIKVGDTILSSVMFGSLNYDVDTDIRFSICSDKILLFENESGRMFASGSMK